MDDRRKELLENYEDAFFKLMMDEIMELKGEELIKNLEELNNSDFKVPEECDKRCLKLIRNSKYPQPTEKYNTHKISFRRTGRVLLVAAIVMALMFSLVYASVPQFRTKVHNVILDIQDEYTRIVFKENEGGEKVKQDIGAPDNELKEGIVLGYIPEGYTVIDERDNYLCLTTEDYRTITAGILQGSDDGFTTWDTENAQVENTILKGNTGMIVRKTDVVFGYEVIDYVWFDNVSLEVFYVCGMGLSEADMLKIFEEIIFN